MAATEGPEPTPYEANLSVEVRCKDCDMETNFIEEFSSGDLICARCGLVVGDRIVDTRSEWRTFANDEGGDDPSRVGDAGDPLFGENALETKVDTSRGQNASGRLVGRLNAANKKTQNDRGQAGLQANFQKIQQYVDTLNAGRQVQDFARHLFKLVDEAKIMKGKTPEAIIAGCIFIACRMNNVGRTFKEIHSLTNVSKKEIGRVYKALEEFIKRNDVVSKPGQGLGLTSDPDPKQKGSTSAEELCARYCSQLGFTSPYLAEKISRRVAEKANMGHKELQLAGRSPLSTAAACIYMASWLIGEHKTSKEIAAIAGVSDGTIKTVYKHLYNAREWIVDSSWNLPEKGGIKNLPAN